MKMSASLDVGLKSLAVWILSLQTGSIARWDVSTIQKSANEPAQKTRISNMISTLENLLEVHQCTDAVVEKQHTKNPTMLMLEGALLVYLQMTIKGRKGNTISPKSKLRKNSRKKKMLHNERKREAAHRCKEELQSRGESSYLHFFMQSKKRDDLADCYLQLWQNKQMLHHSSTSTTEEHETNGSNGNVRTHPRRPTDR